jgi:Polyketide cyclase / dehydrase and lipid transport
MKPIIFSCTGTLPVTPAVIVGRILDLASWIDFKGYGILPGIRTAEYEVRTPGVIGSRVRVTNTDGSSHVELIVEWEPDRRLRLDMTGFSPPLSRLATRFEEVWAFVRLGGSTRVVRSFKLHPKFFLARPLLWGISLLLKRAIARHLRELGDLGGPQIGNRES